MELRAFAEQVLFATTLEEKLRDPGEVTDERPGSAIAVPEMPGRPPELRFKPRGTGKGDFPGLHQLEGERERGRLLHFFGNHELLATELMALVLLRFPDAPAAFRRGVFQTLRDEQEHTRLYVERMKACGLTFGELPVSGFFWRAVSGMESPMDYVAGLCLTFEQANLDFARHFAASFQTVGDAPSAALLERIYRDEIGHVAYGLKWFRRWKNPDESDWDAFCRQLRFPLTPRRARGWTLNAEGRRAAGLDPDFIARLEVFSQSKGRTPDVYLFNPFAEGFIARGPAFTPVRAQASLARDLAILPAFLAGQDDIVLVPRRPRTEFLAALRQAGFVIPEFLECPAAFEPGTGNAPPASLATLRFGSGSGAAERPPERKFGVLRPWAWGPDSLRILGPLLPRVTGENRRPEARFNPGLAQLYSKAWSADFLREFLHSRREQRPDEPWLCGDDVVGRTATTPEAVADLIRAIRERGHHRVVIKETLGLAGASALRLWEPEILEAQHRWIAEATAGGRAVVVEPWLERVLDFSVQFERSTRGLELRGATVLLNDHRGQYEANRAAPDHRQRLPAAVANLLRGAAASVSPAEPLSRTPAPESTTVPRRVAELFTDLRNALEPHLAAANFLGPLGIDAFVYRGADGRCRLKPVVEINPRYTMGRLLVELMTHTCPGTHGLLRLVNRSSLRREGFADFPSFAAALTEHHPVALEGEPVPRIRSGAVPLNDPALAESCLAIFQAGSSAP